MELLIALGLIICVIAWALRQRFDLQRMELVDYAIIFFAFLGWMIWNGAAAEYLSVVYGGFSLRGYGKAIGGIIAIAQMGYCGWLWRK